MEEKVISIGIGKQQKILVKNSRYRLSFFNNFCFHQYILIYREQGPLKRNDMLRDRILNGLRKVDPTIYKVRIQLALTSNELWNGVICTISPRDTLNYAELRTWINSIMHPYRSYFIVPIFDSNNPIIRKSKRNSQSLASVSQTHSIPQALFEWFHEKCLALSASKDHLKLYRDCSIPCPLNAVDFSGYFATSQYLFVLAVPWSKKKSCLPLIDDGNCMRILDYHDHFWYCKLLKIQSASPYADAVFNMAELLPTNLEWSLIPLDPLVSKLNLSGASKDIAHRPRYWLDRFVVEKCMEYFLPADCGYTKYSFIPPGESLMTKNLPV
jgi:hypothetical protein